MRFRTKIIAALAIIVTSIVFSAFVASPTIASNADCFPYHGTVCLADGAPDFRGQVWRQTPSQIIGCRKLSPEGFDNKASVAFNNTFGDGVLYLYDTNNCTGKNIALVSQKGTQFRNQDAWLNNKTSSVKFVQY